jgi:hypothetical protein
MSAFPLYSSHRPTTETTCANGRALRRVLARRYRLVLTPVLVDELAVRGGGGARRCHERPYLGDCWHGCGRQGGNCSPYFFYHRRAVRRHERATAVTPFWYEVPQPTRNYLSFVLDPFNSCVELLGALLALRRRCATALVTWWSAPPCLAETSGESREVVDSSTNGRD